jgi:hypothetical protein
VCIIYLHASHKMKVKGNHTCILNILIEKLRDEGAKHDISINSIVIRNLISIEFNHLHNRMACSQSDLTLINLMLNTLNGILSFFIATTARMKIIIMKAANVEC